MKLYTKLLVISIAIFAIVLALYFNFGSFVSDLYLQTQRKGAAIPADPTCPKGQYSKKTGGVCSGASSDNYDYSKDPPQTRVNKYGERYNVGAYDLDPSKDEDNTKTDVLNKPATINYADWVLDPKTNRDLNTGSTLSNSQFNTYKKVDNLDSKKSREDKVPYNWKYDTSLNSKGATLDDVYNKDLDTETKYKLAKKNRPSVDELIKRKSDNENDYMNNRLERDHKRRERQFDIPSSSDKKEEPSDTSYDDEDEEECEGFSPLL